MILCYSPREVGFIQVDSERFIGLDRDSSFEHSPFPQCINSGLQTVT